MATHVKKRSETIGMPPGSLVYIGGKPQKEVTITVTNYNEQDFDEFTKTSFRECLVFAKETAHVTWIDINSYQHLNDLKYLGECFQLHPLVLEDILNSDQRPKVEDFGDYLFIIAKMLHHDEKTNIVLTEQISFILGNNYVISLHENDTDIFAPVRQRLKNSSGRIRKAKADYLAYALLDIIVDNYFLVLEQLGEVVEDLEEELVTSPGPATLNKIYSLKRNTILIRRAVWPLREVVSKLDRSDSALIEENTFLYLRDVYDHVTIAMDSIETYRDILSGILDIYLSSISNRLNEVMKVLTIIATIFIPLTFIAGVYGMNFKYMPELEWHYGYFMIIGIMLSVALIMLHFFKRRGWIGKRRTF
jgi:magnesium transporter